MDARILIVDDIEINLNLIVNILTNSQEDFEIITASNAKEGIEKAINELPDIILMDWELPEVNGLDAIKTLKHNPLTKDIPILMITAYASPEHLQECFEAGVIDYIKKPVEILELRSRVKSAANLANSIKIIKKQTERIEKQVKELEKLAIVAKETSNGFAIFDLNGNLEWANQSFELMHGISLKNKKNLNQDDIYAENNKIQECITTNKSITFTTTINNNGQKYWLQVSLSPSSTQNNIPGKIIALETDITQIKEKEEELNRRNIEMTAITNNLENANKKLEEQAREINLQKTQLEAEKRRAESLLQNILPFEIAKQLKNKGVSKPRNYSIVTVMFADFKDFSHNSLKIDPIDLVSTLDNYFKKFDEIIDSHFLEKIKTIGDAYMAAGGLPLRNRSNPLNTVMAALQIQDYMNDLNDKKILKNETIWELRVGIHTGPVIAGVVGKNKFAYDIWGQTVNIASRMESSGYVGMVNISGDTYEHIKEYFDCTYRGKIEAKNIGKIDMYFVVGIRKEYAADKKRIYPNDKLKGILNRL